ncbi:unnamed protein product [Acanthosepion pharaonis]|uniref:Uncharacterized protein n=1 Tax=Acanthosepion pharaonis TaxID=158019 RepID=A0A812C2Q9_ACAPH|nr:unnamed protein product [Sepia pharaonis]
MERAVTTRPEGALPREKEVSNAIVVVLFFFSLSLSLSFLFKIFLLTFFFLFYFYDCFLFSVLQFFPHVFFSFTLKPFSSVIVGVNCCCCFCFFLFFVFLPDLAIFLSHALSFILISHSLSRLFSLPIPLDTCSLSLCDLPVLSILTLILSALSLSLPCFYP